MRPQDSTATPQIFVILHSCRYRSPVPPAVRNKQEDAIGNSGSSSQRARDYLNIVYSTAERARTANWQTETSHLLHFIFPENPVGAAVRKSVGPEANRGLDVLSLWPCTEVRALVRRAVFAWPRAVKGCRNRTPPSSTNNRAEKCCTI